MERCGQQGEEPDRGQDAAAAAFNTTQDAPPLPPTDSRTDDSSSSCSMQRSKSQSADVMNSLRELQLDGVVSDFTLHLKEGPVPFSRNLLASMSPFFDKMFTVDMKESRSNEVNMQHVTQDTWTCITSFYFSSSKLVSVDNVQDVLETSHMYGLEKLVQYCSEVLQSHCCADNWFDLLEVATRFDLESLAQKAIRVLADNFPTLCKGDDFLSLTKADLLQLLEKEEVVTTEDDLCRALLAWIEKNNADADTCMEVFKQLRLNLMSDECLFNFVLSHNVCIRSPRIQSLVAAEKSRRASLMSFRPTQEKARKRRPGSAKNSLLVFGPSWRDELLAYVWSLDERRWTEILAPSRKVEGSMSCTALEDTVIIRVGTSKRSTHLFDLRTQRWSTGPNLLQERFDEGMTTIGHTAYVVGGQDNNDSTLSSIEEYSKASGQWTATGDLQEAAVGCGVAALGDTILVVGGNTDNVAQLVQTFNVLTRSAAVLDIRLPFAMRYVEAASHGPSVFFLGYQGELVEFKEVEGNLQMSSQLVLENFEPRTFSFRLLASNSCVRVIGGPWDESVSCWDYKGKKIGNDNVVDRLPVEILDCSAVEANIPGTPKNRNVVDHLPLEIVDCFVVEANIPAH